MEEEVMSAYVLDLEGINSKIYLILIAGSILVYGMKLNHIHMVSIQVC